MADGSVVIELRLNDQAGGTLKGILNEIKSAAGNLLKGIGGSGGIGGAVGNIGKLRAAWMGVNYAIDQVRTTWNYVNKEFITAAAHQEAQMFRVSKSFGKMAGEANNWAKEYAKSVKNIVDSDDLAESAAKANNWLSLRGFSVQKSFEMSTKLTELAYETGAKVNEKPDAILNKLAKAVSTGKGFAGTNKYGIDLSDPTMARRAFEMGLISDKLVKTKDGQVKIVSGNTEGDRLKAMQANWRGLDDATKAQLRYNEALRQGEKNMGTLSEKTETYQGAMQRYDVAIGNLKESLGTFFLPAATKWVNSIADFVNEFNEKLEGMSQKDKDKWSNIAGWTVGLTATATVLGTVIDGVSKLATGLKSLWVSGIMPIITSPAFIALATAGGVTLGVDAYGNSLLNNTKQNAKGKTWKDYGYGGVEGTIGQQLGGDLKSLFDADIKLLQGIGSAAVKVWDGIKKGTQEAWMYISGKVMLAVSDLRGWLGKQAGPLKEAVNKWFHNLPNPIQNFISGIKAAVNGLVVFMRTIKIPAPSFMPWKLPSFKTPQQKEVEALQDKNRNIRQKKAGTGGKAKPYMDSTDMGLGGMTPAEIAGGYVDIITKGGSNTYGYKPSAVKSSGKPDITDFKYNIGNTDYDFAGIAEDINTSLKKDTEILKENERTNIILEKIKDKIDAINAGVKKQNEIADEMKNKLAEIKAYNDQIKIDESNRESNKKLGIKLYEDERLAETAERWREQKEKYEQEQQDIKAAREAKKQKMYQMAYGGIDAIQKGAGGDWWGAGQAIAGILPPNIGGPLSLALTAGQAIMGLFGKKKAAPPEKVHEPIPVNVVNLQQLTNVVLKVSQFAMMTIRAINMNAGYNMLNMQMTRVGV